MLRFKKIKNLIKKYIKIIMRTFFMVVIGSVFLPFFLKTLSDLYQNFLLSSISYNLDTLYLNWNTSFPAVTVCEIYNGEKIWDISEEHFGPDRDSRVDDFISEVVFYKGACNACENCDEMDCPTNFDELLRVFRKDCSALFKDCSWSSKSFECCEEFRALRTEYGMCFSFNSMQANEVPIPKYITNRELGPGYLNFYVTEDVQVYVHAPIDIPYLFSDGAIRETVLWGTNKEIIFNVLEIFNDPSIGFLNPDERNCRFKNELPDDGLHSYKFYSFSTCVVECLQLIQVKLCQCIPPFLMSNGENATLGYQFCDVNGLKCISEKIRDILEERKKCNCLNSCEEPEYNIVYASPEESQGDGDKSKIRISMIELPTQRYVRKVAKSYLDLIISVGGIAGLYFGASLLRIIERFYLIYCFIKKLNKKN